MNVSGTFKITVQGDPKTGTDAYTFQLQVSARVRQIDPVFRFEETNFQRITYILVWSGVPQNLVAVDQAQKYIAERMGKSFRRWTYSIELNYEEKGGV